MIVSDDFIVLKVPAIHKFVFTDAEKIRVSVAHSQPADSVDVSRQRQLQAAFHTSTTFSKVPVTHHIL
jgi:hypothetical protein